MNHFSPPTTYASHYKSLFGLYDSSDPHVLSSQALLMKFAGIDGIIADWYGIECYYDYCLIKDSTNLFIPYIKRANLEFSICYEDRTVEIMLDEHHFPTRSAALAHGVSVMQWLQSNYFNDPCYTKIDSRPVLLNFGPEFFTSSEWNTLFNPLNPKPHFFPFRNNYVAARTGGFDWPIPQWGTVTGHLDEFYNWAQNWQHYIAAAFPRFRDIYEEAGLDYFYPDIDAQGSYGSYGTSTYSYTLERGLQSDADFVQLVTWNDYGEGTIIEPTEEDGYLFLKITQQKRKQYIEPDFPYTAEDLRLPVRLYVLRKANLNYPQIMEQLTLAEDYLYSDNLNAAEKIFNQLECDTLLSGDIDFDCRVNMDDLGSVATAWLSEPGSEEWNWACDIAQPTDNIINFLDFAVIAENWLDTAM